MPFDRCSARSNQGDVENTNAEDERTKFFCEHKRFFFKMHTSSVTLHIMSAICLNSFFLFTAALTLASCLFSQFLYRGMPNHAPKDVGPHTYKTTEFLK